MNFITDSQDYFQESYRNVEYDNNFLWSSEVDLIHKENELIFKKQKQEDDDYLLKRFSLIEDNQERKERIDLKRQIKKQKEEQKKKQEITLSELNSQNQSSLSLSKDEIRKMRNRKSAQSSREKKRQQLETLQQQNSELQSKIVEQEKEILYLRCENEKLSYHVKLYEDLKNRQFCQCCVQNQDQQKFVKAKVQGNQSHVLGFIAIFSIISIFAFYGRIEDKQVNPVFFQQLNTQQIRQKKNNELLEVNKNNDNALNTMFIQCNALNEKCQLIKNLLEIQYKNANIITVGQTEIENAFLKDFKQKMALEVGQELIMIEINNNLWMQKSKCLVHEINGVQVDESNTNIIPFL